MRLTQIKLSGFKSFVDPTAVQVPSQLVAIVGPNGCGKSNIIDAVRWVLGESKASELRGESMQDVIFNGSLNRKAAARASVELVFDNSEGKASGQWSPFVEISVKRILTKEGQSSYWINHQQVRRKDIHDLFLGTGLGARGYAIIGQGMIARIIEARPEELRVFLEEAAGVSRYKERRKETESRLADTRDNLIRVEDILKELDDQLARLSLQAEVATRYKNLQEEGDQKLHAFWLVKKHTAEREKIIWAKELEQLQLQQDESVAQLRRLEARLEEVRQAYHDATDHVQNVQAKLYEANAAVTKHETEIRFISDSKARSLQQIEQLGHQKKHWHNQLQHYQQIHLETQALLEEALVTLEETTYQLEDLQVQVPEKEEFLQQKSSVLTQNKDQLIQAQRELALVRQSQQNLINRIQDIDLRAERLRKDLLGIEKPNAEKIHELKTELLSTAEQLAQAQEQLLEREQQQRVLDDERNHAVSDYQKEQNEVHQLEARLNALNQLQERVQGQAKIVPWLQKHGLEGLDALWQKIHITPGWEAALEASLREQLYALEVADINIAQRLLDDETLPAKVSLYQRSSEIYETREHGTLRPLFSLVRCQDQELSQLLESLLHGFYLSESINDALHLKSSLQLGQRLVVPAGHIITQQTVQLYAADTEESGMLARQQEIENIRLQIKAQELLLSETNKRVIDVQGRLQDCVQIIPTLRLRVSEKTERLHRLQMDEKAWQTETQNTENREQQILSFQEDLLIQKEELLASQEDFEQQYAQLNETLADLEQSALSSEEEVKLATQQLTELRTQIRSVETAHQEKQFYHRSLVAKLKETDDHLNTAQEQSLRVESEFESLNELNKEYDDEQARYALEESLIIRTEQEQNLAQARIKMDNFAAELREMDEKRLFLDRSLEPIRTKSHELLLKEQAARLAEEQFTEQLSLHNVDVVSLQERLNNMPEEWSKASWLNSEVQRITGALNALGAVNLAALEELAVAQERKVFLDSQQQDLLSAIETLEDAIKKIDRETRALLQDTFDQVNTHFGELFPSLFGGGEAKLVMTGEEILDAGVQVMAQPPGKRNSTIHLLSGGEKALTATALVFAMFKLNPAPFCLLDEVDAPLDDANTERYAKLVKKMSAHTQFLFISHNKIAMEIAHQLIGVTMQEQGVSRIVAVDIDAAMKMSTE